MDHPLSRAPTCRYYHPSHAPTSSYYHPSHAPTCRYYHPSRAPTCTYCRQRQTLQSAGLRRALRGRTRRSGAAVWSAASSSLCPASGPSPGWTSPAPPGEQTRRHARVYDAKRGHFSGNRFRQKKIFFAKMYCTVLENYTIHGDLRTLIPRNEFNCPSMFQPHNHI